MKLGLIEWLPSDEIHRPSLWIDLRRRMLIVFFGWQKPTVLWWRIR